MRLARTGFVETRAGALDFRQGADATFAQARDQFDENGGRRNRITECAVPMLYLDSGPTGDGIERKVRQVGPQQVDQEAHVETARRNPIEASEFAFAFQHRQVKPARVTHQHRILAPLVEVVHDLGKAGRIGDIGIADTVYRLAVGRNRYARIDHCSKITRFVYLTVQNTDRAYFNHARLAGIKPGSFAVEGDRIQRQQWNRCGVV